jgi:hypothetical protein
MWVGGTIMTTQQRDDQALPNSSARLERAYIDEYLRGQGFDAEALKKLPRAQATTLMRAASLYASMRLSEVEARSHLMEEMHGGPQPL